MSVGPLSSWNKHSVGNLKHPSQLFDDRVALASLLGWVFVQILPLVSLATVRLARHNAFGGQKRKYINGTSTALFYCPVKIVNLSHRPKLQRPLLPILKMKYQLSCLLAFLLLGLALGGGEAMPEIVQKFQETRDLWEGLHRTQQLYGHESTPLGWRQLLQTRGQAIVDDL